MSSAQSTSTTIPQVRFRTVDGVRIRYADTGGLQKPAVLPTSPLPETVYASAGIWATLAEHARLFAVDLSGLGASERRDGLLSPRAMGKFLAQLLVNAEFLDERLPTSRVVVVDAGHFAWEEAPTEYASIVLDAIGATAHDTGRTSSTSPATTSKGRNHRRTFG